MDVPRVILTGANRGLGKDVLRLIIQKNPQFHVIATARSNIAELQSKTNEEFANNNVKFMQLDIQYKESISNFVASINSLGVKFDALINNAALGCDFGQKIPSVDLATNTLNINVIGTIQLTQGILPFLKDNGRVINVSSKLAALRFQGKSIIQIYENPQLKMEDIHETVRDYIDDCKKQDLKQYFKSVYGTSKMLLNAWSRFILSKQLKQTQMTICMSPGHCQTDMGGPHAVRTSLQGATLIYNHLFGQYKNSQFYHSMQPFNFYDCGPH